MAREIILLIAATGALGACATMDRDAVRQAAASECNRQGGYEFALSKAAYSGGCTTQSEAAFLEGYVMGRQIRRLEDDRRVAAAAYARALNDSENQAKGVATDYSRVSMDQKAVSMRPDAADAECVAAKKRLEKVTAKLKGAREAAKVSMRDAANAAISRNEMGAKIEVLATAHAFARTTDSITHCTDEIHGLSPRCALAPEARIVDTATGDQCASGAGALKFISSEHPASSADGPQRIDNYMFYPKNRTDKLRNTAAISIVTDPDTGALLAVTCAN